MRLVDVAVIGVLVLTVLGMPGGHCYAEGPKRPNVVLIIADDMGWDDFGAHGNPKFTPCSTTLAPCRTKCTRSSRRRG